MAYEGVCCQELLRTYATRFEAIYEKPFVVLGIEVQLSPDVHNYETEGRSSGQILLLFKPGLIAPKIVFKSESLIFDKPQVV